jgi:uncharacterized protein (TIGR00297 family)
LSIVSPDRDVTSSGVDLLQILIGLALSIAIALFAHRQAALTAGGVCAAILVGTLTFGFGGCTWGLVLIAFFVLCSLLSRYRLVDKAKVAEKFAKGAQRDAAQVLANGSLAAFSALLYFSQPTPLWLAAFLGSMATATADTWGTEIGVLSRDPPRLITTGKRVPPGTSGGISLLGTSASVLGALVIGLVAYVLTYVQTVLSGGSALQLSWIVPTTLLSGLLGSLFDSLLGATMQGIFYCAQCQVQTEKPLHGCGLRTTHVRGWRWLNNDMVNFLSSICGALLAIALWGVIAPR